MAGVKEKGLLDLPPEVLCQLFTFLPPRQVITGIPLVCQRFNNITNDKAFWKSRILNEQNVRLPSCEMRHPEYEPKQSFYMMYQQRERWKDWESQRVIAAPGHAATVDSVMLFEKNNKLFCLSGSRDRSLRLWDVNSISSGENSEENPWTVASDETSHSGWIWNSARDATTERFYTTSWDSTVKSWDITDNGTLRNLSSVNVGSAAQCVSTAGNENEIVCTTFAKRVAVIDSRSFEVVGEHKLHKSAVIALAVQGDKIFTSSEDRLMMMVDRRNMKKPVLFEYSKDSYKTCLSLQRNQLLCSTSDGKVKLYDANNFNVLQTYKAGKYTRQSLLHHGAHFVTARSKTGQYQFMVLSPGVRSQELCASHLLTAEPTKFDFSSRTKTLAIGNGDSSVLFCFPKPDQD